MSVSKTAVPEAPVTSLPGLYAWRPCNAERLETSHHLCSQPGIQTDVARVQWHYHLSLIGQT